MIVHNGVQQSYKLTILKDAFKMSFKDVSKSMSDISR
jgi:hypothetical protein